MDDQKKAKENIRRILLTVSYDGSRYCGWQVQPNGLSVQEVLNGALSELLKTKTAVTGASRTDAGVHAAGNAAVFDTTARMPADRFAFALNTYLPDDIRIQKSVEVPSGFHPRYTETVKTYDYLILNRQMPDPCRRLYAYFIYGNLDADAMRQAAAHFVGTHDFISFASAGGNTAGTKSSVRTVYSAEVQREGDMIRFRICGNGFLYNMVRIIAGTLIEVGKGKIRPDAIPEILAARDREKAGPTAPARGLTLRSIRYPELEEASRVFPGK